MNTPLSTPIHQVKLAINSSKSHPLACECKKLLAEQHQRLWTKHQQDLDLIDDMRAYVKARLSIERDYTSALGKLSKQHSSQISKKFVLLNQMDPVTRNEPVSSTDDQSKSGPQMLHDSEISDSRLQKRLANNGLDEPEKACSLYKVWSEHVSRLNLASKNRADQFEQLIMVVDKLKDIRTHKATVGKKCLDSYLKRVHEDVVASMIDVEKTRKLYHEDESQAKKARENEEKIKKKRSGLLTKFTDLQAKKEKTSAQREANDIQSTQARNDYIMALAAGNAHLNHYHHRDLTDFMNLIDDNVLDHCKIFMATLSECDINSLKDTLSHAQYWSKMINLTGSQKTNSIFYESEKSECLRNKFNLNFEPCNNDPIQSISLEHNADYALQHEIDKWFTWFKKECRNLSQLLHQLETCQRALAEGKKSIELNGQVTEDLEPKIIDLKQQIRKSEAAKIKAQARLKVIKEGGMQIEEWSAVESEIRADMARAQEELEIQRAKERSKESQEHDEHDDNVGGEQDIKQARGYVFDSRNQQIQLQVSADSDDGEANQSIHNPASVSRSNSNLMQTQNKAQSAYSALTDPSSAWQDDYSCAWGSPQGNYNVVVTSTYDAKTSNSPSNNNLVEHDSDRYDLLSASKKQDSQNQAASMTVQSSSPLSAIINGAQSTPSPNHGLAGDAYKSDFECDYNRDGHLMRSTVNSVEPGDSVSHPPVVSEDQREQETDTFLPDVASKDHYEQTRLGQTDASKLVNKLVIAMYSFDKTNDDDLAFAEGDVLRVTEVNDEDWYRATNEATGIAGYIPASYVAPYNGTPWNECIEIPKSGGKNLPVEDGFIPSGDCNASINQEDDFEDDLGASKEMTAPAYCRASYDYEPEVNTFEDDGLPHLKLTKGELMRIIEQGEDDGWWLVEKEQGGMRGHVPSMLVREVNPDAEEEDSDDDDGEGSECSIGSDQRVSIKGMPTFLPPALTELSESHEVAQEEDKKVVTSLVPTSFIIIEPTPEVESKRVYDSQPVESFEPDPPGKETSSRQVVHSNTSKPPADVSYSVINEDFVLEKPSRIPYQHSDQSSSAPAIEQESPADERSDYQEIEASLRSPDEKFATVAGTDGYDLPAPPSVVIESVEDDKHDSSSSFNDDNNSGEEMSDEMENDQANTYISKEIKHTGNVNVNPMLRHRAEEFSKQIIAEAIMLAPGADVGPSTSSANMT